MRWLSRSLSEQFERYPQSVGLLAVGVAFVGLLATLSTLVAERRRDLAIRSALVIGAGALLTAYLAALRARSLDPLLVLSDE
jgi:hypothetical protein